MSEAATQQKGVAEMSDAEMVNSLAEMFNGPQDPLENLAEEPAAEDSDPTVEGDDGETSEDTEADKDTEVEADDESEDEEEDSSDDERWTPKSLDELAEALEMKPEDVAETLRVRIKVDGQEGEATLKDVIKSYQLEKTLNGRLEAHANERKAFEAQTSELVGKLQERLQEIDSTASAMEQMLYAEYQSVDWNDLRQNDPTEYLVKQQEMRERYASIQQVRTQLDEDRQKQQQEMQQKQSEQVQAYLQQQKQALLDKLPEWRDSEKMQSDLEQLQEYLRSNGTSDQEIASISDHRVYLMALKAMRYDQMHSKADPKMKQMKTKPKFVKPGARKDPAKASDKRKQSAMNRAKDLQTDDAWAEALLAKLS